MVAHSCHVVEEVRSSRIVREVRSVHNTQQAQYALLDALTKYVSTCVVEPPQDLLVSAGFERYRLVFAS